jgi:signal transduction histidine kinase
VSGASAELRAVIKAMPEAVFVCDSRDRVRLVNPAADRLFRGRPVRDARDLLSRFDGPLRDALPAGDDAPLRLPHLPGREFSLRSYPIEREGGGRGRPADAGGRILVLRDVTASREDRAERNAFLSILSHELRTPITTIYAGSRVLARRESRGAARGSPEIAADISAEAARLYDVVEDLLVLTRAEQGILELSEDPVHLKRIAESVIRVATSRAPTVPVVFAGMADPPAVHGDAVYVEQVIRNLVNAASRFAGPGEPVVVRIDATDTEASISVVDHGPPLTDEELDTAFDIVHEQAGHRRTSAGIALFVCRRLIEAMKGRIWIARPSAGGSAEYGFALPRYAVAD